MSDTELIQIKKDIAEIQRRNKSVENDKAWETSLFRRVLIAIFTYLSIGLYMWAIAVTDPWLNAIVPTVGFTLSTLTLPWFKAYWLRRNR